MEIVDKGKIDELFNIKHFFSDGLYAKQSLMPKGSVGEKHVHSYSHLSILGSGKVIVDINGDKYTYEAPCCIEIKAGLYHTITALEDSMWYCIHATDATSADDIDNVLISKGE